VLDLDGVEPIVRARALGEIDAHVRVVADARPSHEPRELESLAFEQPMRGVRVDEGVVPRVVVVVDAGLPLEQGQLETPFPHRLRIG